MAVSIERREKKFRKRMPKTNSQPNSANHRLDPPSSSASGKAVAARRIPREPFNGRKNSPNGRLQNTNTLPTEGCTNPPGFCPSSSSLYSMRGHAHLFSCRFHQLRVPEQARRKARNISICLGSSLATRLHINILVLTEFEDDKKGRLGFSLLSHHHPTPPYKIVSMLTASIRKDVTTHGQPFPNQV